jgi:hypothetical protein
MLSSINYVRLQIRRAQAAPNEPETRAALSRALDGLDRIECEVRDAVATADALCAEVNELAAEFEEDSLPSGLVVGLKGEELLLGAVFAKEGRDDKSKLMQKDRFAEIHK